MMQQLSLFDFVDSSQECVDYQGHQLPLRIERSVSWADGDVSQAALARLARVEVELHSAITVYFGPPVSTKNLEAFRDGIPVAGYTRHLYRCESAVIEGDRVIGTYKYDSVLTCRTVEGIE